MGGVLDNVLLEEGKVPFLGRIEDREAAFDRLAAAEGGLECEVGVWEGGASCGDCASFADSAFDDFVNGRSLRLGERRWPEDHGGRGRGAGRGRPEKAVQEETPETGAGG